MQKPLYRVHFQNLFILRIDEKPIFFGRSSVKSWRFGETQSLSALITYSGIVVMLIFCSVSAAGSDSLGNTIFALTNITSSSIKAPDNKILAARFASELSLAGLTGVMDIPERDKILASSPPTGCADITCVSRVGKVLGVKKIIASTVSVFGSTWTLQVQVINVESGAVEKTTLKDCTGGKECLLGSFKSIAEELFTLYPPPVAVPEKKIQVMNVNQMRPAASAKEIVTTIGQLCDSLLKSVPDSVRGNTVAVLPFSDNSPDGVDQGKTVPEILIAELQKRKTFVLVDRMDLQKAMAEIALSQTGIISDTQALAVGKTIAAKYLIVGSVSSGNETFTVTARIVHTESQQVIAAAALCANAGAMTALTKELLGERIQVSSSIFRSALVPGWGQIYSHEPLQGAISMTVCLGALGFTLFALAAQDAAYNKYLDQNNYMLSDAYWRAVSTDAQAENRANTTLKTRYNDYSGKYDLMIAAGITTGALWLVNCVDAAWTGVQSKKKISLYFSSDISSTTSLGLTMKF
jgi:TolB-like protein